MNQRIARQLLVLLSLWAAVSHADDVPPPCRLDGIVDHAPLTALGWNAVEKDEVLPFREEGIRSTFVTALRSPAGSWLFASCTERAGDTDAITVDWLEEMVSAEAYARLRPVRFAVKRTERALGTEALAAINVSFVSSHLGYGVGTSDGPVEYRAVFLPFVVQRGTRFDKLLLVLDYRGARGLTADVQQLEAVASHLRWPFADAAVLDPDEYNRARGLLARLGERSPLPSAQVPVSTPAPPGGPAQVLLDGVAGKATAAQLEGLSREFVGATGRLAASLASDARHREASQVLAELRRHLASHGTREQQVELLVRSILAGVEAEDHESVEQSLQWASSVADPRGPLLVAEASPERLRTFLAAVLPQAAARGRAMDLLLRDPASPALRLENESHHAALGVAARNSGHALPLIETLARQTSGGWSPNRGVSHPTLVQEGPWIGCLYPSSRATPHFVRLKSLADLRCRTRH